MDSWDYAKAAKGDRTRFFSCGFATLNRGLEAAHLDGLVLEFGVLFGLSINHIAQRCAAPVYGFDSFEGLPEAWGHNPAGAYSAKGELPEVEKNVTLFKGWFEDTLPNFISHHRDPIRFMNIDCDIYSSTRTVMTAFASQISAGAVLVFDEYLCTAQWREDEYRAFQEAVEENGWRYEYLAFNLFSKQAVIQIR